MSIINFLDVSDVAREAMLPHLDAIFFESSGTKVFPTAAARLDFRERWLGRYLEHDANWFYVALAHDGEPLGYLAGSLADPATSPRFADIAYFAAFAHLTARFPAHLHINLAPAARSRGIGSRLIERFASDASRAGAPGVHVVTGRGMRNVGFYGRNGFHEAGAVSWNGRELVFLARVLAM